MLVERIQQVQPDAWIAVAGDFNVFPRPDEPMPEVPQDQLGQLYDAGLINLWDDALRADAKTAYTYIFRGQAQTLDQIFVTHSLHQSLRDVWIAHINADYPAMMSDRRGYSDHDPVVAGFYVPKID
jgi:predicted extracellular nuclease